MWRGGGERPNFDGEPRAGQSHPEADAAGPFFFGDRGSLANARSEPVRCVCHKKLTAYDPSRWTVKVRRLGLTPPRPSDVEGFEIKCFRCHHYVDVVPEPCDEAKAAA